MADVTLGEAIGLLSNVSATLSEKLKTLESSMEDYNVEGGPKSEKSPEIISFLDGHLSYIKDQNDNKITLLSNIDNNISKLLSNLGSSNDKVSSPDIIRGLKKDSEPKKNIPKKQQTNSAGLLKSLKETVPDKQTEKKPRSVVEKATPVIIRNFSKSALDDISSLITKPTKKEEKPEKQGSILDGIKKLIGPAILVLGGLGALVAGIMSDGPLTGFLKILAKGGITGGIKMFSSLLSKQISFFTKSLKALLPEKLLAGIVSKAKGFLSSIGKFLLKPFSILGGKAAGTGIFKTLTGLFGKFLKPVLKRIPGIGSLISWAFAIKRFKNGQLVRGLIDLASGIATLFPGPGTLISIGLDVLNAFLDIKAGKEDKVETGKNKFDLKEFFGKIQDKILNNYPIKNLMNFWTGVGKVFKGDFKEGFKQMAFAVPFVQPLSEFLFGSTDSEGVKKEGLLSKGLNLFDKIKDSLLRRLLKFIPETILGVSVRSRVANLLGIDMGPVVDEKNESSSSDSVSSKDEEKNKEEDEQRERKKKEEEEERKRKEKEEKKRKKQEEFDKKVDSFLEEKEDDGFIARRLKRRARENREKNNQSTDTQATAAQTEIPPATPVSRAAETAGTAAPPQATPTATETPPTTPVSRAAETAGAVSPPQSTATATETPPTTPVSRAAETAGVVLPDKEQDTTSEPGSSKLQKFYNTSTGDNRSANTISSAGNLLFTKAFANQKLDDLQFNRVEIDKEEYLRAKRNGRIAISEQDGKYYKYSRYPYGKSKLLENSLYLAERKKKISPKSILEAGIEDPSIIGEVVSTFGDPERIQEGDKYMSEFKSLTNMSEGSENLMDYIKNKAIELIKSGKIKELEDIKNAAGGASNKAKPKLLKNFDFIDGKSEPIIMNDEEKLFKDVKGKFDAILNKKQLDDVDNTIQDGLTSEFKVPPVSLPQDKFMDKIQPLKSKFTNITKPFDLKDFIKPVSKPSELKTKKDKEISPEAKLLEQMYNLSSENYKKHTELLEESLTTLRDIQDNIINSQGTNTIVNTANITNTETKKLRVFQENNTY